MAKGVLFILFFFSQVGFAAASRGGGGNFQSKMMSAGNRAAKESSQWTLVDWLTQKNKMRLADQWLALNRSATFYEMIAGGAHNRYTLKSTDAGGVSTSQSRDAQTYTLDLYFTIFNLYGEYEKTSDHRESYGGAAGFRLFGTSSQTTALLARYGWRKLSNLETQEVWENQFAEGDLQLYIFKNFGIHGRYRHFFPNKSNLGNDLSGSRTTAGAFLEAMLFRVYGDYYLEPVEYKDATGVLTKEQREGYEVGLKLFF